MSTVIKPLDIQEPACSASGQSAMEILHELEQRRFYGSLEIKIEAGRIVLMRKTETIKPADRNYRDNRGTGNEREK